MLLILITRHPPIAVQLVSRHVDTASGYQNQLGVGEARCLESCNQGSMIDLTHDGMAGMGFFFAVILPSYPPPSEL